MTNTVSCQERFQNLITELIFQDSYWGYLFSKINRRLDLSLPAPMGVTPESDGTIALLYNSLFLNEIDDDFFKIIIQHEGLHVLNNHIPRCLRILTDETDKSKKTYKMLKWNIAADCAVNSLLPGIKKKYKFGKTELSVVLPEQYNLPENKTSEFYFVSIPDPKDKKGKGGEGENTDGDSNGKGNGNLDDHSQWEKIASEVSDVSSLASRIENYNNSVIEQSFQSVRNKGNIPGYIYDKIEEILKKPQVPYYYLITKFVKGTRLSKHRRAYTRLNKKRVYSFFIDDTKLPSISPFPGKKTDFSFKITVIIDTSGSMSKDDIMEALSGIKNIIENDKDCETFVIENDTKIQKEYQVKKISDIQFSVQGRGGTALLPAMYRAREIQSDVVLVFTDGYCEDLNKYRNSLPKKILYILTHGGTQQTLDQTGFVVRLPRRS